LKNQSSRSHGPGLSDPRRLRRWLREMEQRMEKIPTLNVEIEAWRRSWGSGHSHSSCSLQSSATTATGSGTGKDDFWAALQTNYNYIMDTNLLESCKEARGEIEGNIIPNVQDTDCCKK
uniref:CSON004129 protein n=1 Tax=Culicoides sonorensis TaxID=179676 RepID=A0A336MQM1_CULSO